MLFRSVLDGVDGMPRPGWYAAGWIKRGPQGVIGTNKPDARGTVTALLADLHRGAVLAPAAATPDAVSALLASRCERVVSFEDWQVIDRLEREAGAREGRPRRKFTTVPAMLQALS